MKKKDHLTKEGLDQIKAGMKGNKIFWLKIKVYNFGFLFIAAHTLA